MARTTSLRRLLADPPPQFVFEIAPDAIRMARTADPAAIVSEQLPAGAVNPSPLHDNIGSAEALQSAVSRLATSGRGGNRTAAVLLPDHCAYLSVLDFDQFPDKPEEQASLIRFRLKRSIPFDVESAALSYWVQPASPGQKARREVVVAVTALEIVSRYESPFRTAGIQPGLVTLAPLACFDLIEREGIIAVARLSGAVLSILVSANGILRAIRSIALEELILEEIASHLHQTFVFIEDNVGSLPSELRIAGFESLESGALGSLPAAMQVPVTRLGGADTAIRGYLKGLAA